MNLKKLEKKIENSICLISNEILESGEKVNKKDREKMERIIMNILLDEFEGDNGEALRDEVLYYLNHKK